MKSCIYLCVSFLLCLPLLLARSAFAEPDYTFTNPAPALSDETMIDDARRYAAGIAFGQNALQQQLMATKDKANQRSPMTPSMKPMTGIEAPAPSQSAASMAMHDKVFDENNTLAALMLWQQLTRQEAFIRRQQQLATTLDYWVEEPYGQARSAALVQVKEAYSALLRDFNAGEFLYRAKIIAERARQDLDMYRAMKSVQTSGPARDHAIALFADAENAMIESKLATALSLWEQTAKAFNENAFQEVIQGFIDANSAGDKRAQLKRESIALKVHAFLNNYFIDIPAGEFRMGSADGDADELPVQTVAIAPFKLGRGEITVELWSLCVKTRMCYRSLSDQKNKSSLPVVNISVQEIHEQFIPWLEYITERHYRLPTEAEWEYAARAGTSSAFDWGDKPDCTRARYRYLPDEACAPAKGSSAMGTYPANAFGLENMHGNVWEWTASCYHDTLMQPTVSEPREHCGLYSIRGGSWKEGARAMRASNRMAYPAQYQSQTLGFRLVEFTP